MERVLVINDSPFERLIMKDMISRLGYEAKSTDEYSTMNLIESFDPAIVIANMTMSKTSGDQLIAMIKGKKPAIKCYLSSCSKIQPDRLYYPDVDGCIETPISPGNLDKILREDQEPGPAEQDGQQDKSALQSVNTQVLTSELQKEPINQAETIVSDGDSEYQPVKPSFAFCPYCGEKIVEGKIQYVFCPFCGSKF